MGLIWRALRAHLKLRDDARRGFALSGASASLPLSDGSRYGSRRSLRRSGSEPPCTDPGTAVVAASTTSHRSRRRPRPRPGGGDALLPIQDRCAIESKPERRHPCALDHVSAPRAESGCARARRNRIAASPMAKRRATAVGSDGWPVCRRTASRDRGNDAHHAATREKRAKSNTPILMCSTLADRRSPTALRGANGAQDSADLSLRARRTWEAGTRTPDSRLQRPLSIPLNDLLSVARSDVVPTSVRQIRQAPRPALQQVSSPSPALLQRFDAFAGSPSSTSRCAGRSRRAGLSVPRRRRIRRCPPLADP